jgi:cytochrome oxidase Cu insertion factor (SCO1/SenC/PrrC family)
MNLSPRTKFVLMFILFAMPITASYLMFFFWKPKATNNFGELIAPVVALPQETMQITDGRDASATVLAAGLRGKWLMVTIDEGACDEACGKKLYTMRQSRLILSKELDRVVRVVLLDDGKLPTEKIQQDFAGTAFVNAKGSAWLSKLPKPTNDATVGRGYIYAVDPMGNVFMRYRADHDIKQIASDFRRVLKASQLGKDFEGK